MIPALGLLAFAAAAHVGISWAIAQRRGASAARRPHVALVERERWPFVSVIVPAWREGGTLEASLRSLASVDYPEWETLVVAGGDDGTYEAAVRGVQALGRARVIPQEPLGKPAALNAGLAVASGEVVVLLDADSHVDAGWLRALVAPLDASCRAATGRAVPTRLTAVTRGEQMERIAWYEILGHRTLQGAASIAIDKALIEQLGGFPADSYADDWELDARVAALGIDRAYCRDAVVRTERPSTLAEYWRNEIRWRRAHLASLIRLRHYFFGDALTGLKSVYPYVLAWGAAAISAVAVVITVVGSPDERSAAIGFWAIAIAWVLMRRSSLPVEVAAYTGDRRWLRDLWVPPVLFGITMLASIWATVTLRRVTLDFKGPRAITGDRPTGDQPT